MATKSVTLPVYSQSGEKVSTVKLAANVFGVEVNEQVMFDAVQVYQANKRQATAQTKTRAEVSGGGKKPWRQKGTGRARAGSTRSPIWVGGGISKGPDGNQNYTLQQNRKAHDLALKSALTLKAENGFLIVDDLKIEGKTKEMAAVLKALKADKKVLVVTNNDTIWNAARNLKTVTVRELNNVSVYDLLNAKWVVITKEDIQKVEEDLK